MRSALRIGVVLGTRPEVMKNYSIVQALRARGCWLRVLHTNQHTGDVMRDAIFAELDYWPDHVMDGQYEIGRAITWLSERIRRDAIDLILVNGDTAAALAGAVAATYTDVGLAHVEAGLRSFDPEMLEERNRIMVDAAAHYLFAYTEQDADRLRANTELRGRVECVGNTTVDLLSDFSDRLARPDEGRYAFATVHRKELTDRPDKLVEVLSALDRLAEHFDSVVLPLHPRTADVCRSGGLSDRVLQRVRVCPPMPPMEALGYVRHADLVLTDSGCVQEEAYLLGVPCVTLRENTERVATVAAGANVLAGFDGDRIVAAALKQRAIRGPYPPLYGEPGVGERIVDTLLRRFRSFRDY